MCNEPIMLQGGTKMKAQHLLSILVLGLILSSPGFTQGWDMYAISGDVVVWQDNRSGAWNIYAVVLDGPEVAKCTSQIAGDANGDCKIDFEDFALLGSAWLECNLQPQESCWQ